MGTTLENLTLDGGGILAGRVGPSYAGYQGLPIINAIQRLSHGSPIFLLMNLRRWESLLRSYLNHIGYVDLTYRGKDSDCMLVSFLQYYPRDHVSLILSNRSCIVGL
jgi:hypothetical protein